jgi:hypothetical protein
MSDLLSAGLITVGLAAVFVTALLIGIHFFVSSGRIVLPVARTKQWNSWFPRFPLSYFFSEFCSADPDKAKVCPAAIAGAQRGTCWQMARRLLAPPTDQKPQVKCEDVLSTLSACPFCRLCNAADVLPVECIAHTAGTDANAGGDAGCPEGCGDWKATEGCDIGENESDKPCKCHVRYNIIENHMKCQAAVDDVKKRCPGCCGCSIENACTASGEPAASEGDC